MKRIAALILSICLLLTVTSAFAETATMTRTSLGDFSLELDPSALTLQTKANNDIMAWYYPIAGDTTVNMNVVWSTDIMDLNAMTQDDIDEFAELLLSTIASSLEALGVEITESETYETAVGELDGVPTLLIAHGLTYDMTPLGLPAQVSLCQVEAILCLESESYIITCTMPDQETFEQYLGPVLFSLQWN